MNNLKNENINNDMLNNEKEDSITLDTESSEQSENIESKDSAVIETADNSSDETVQNEDCGKLPQNQKDDKKNKWLLLVIGIATVIIAGILTTKFLSKDNKPEEPIDYMQYVQGIEDLELTSSKEKYDYLSGVTFDKGQINSVTVDDSEIDLNKPGEYKLTYLIDVKDETVEDIEKEVTVKVISGKKEEKPGDEKKDDDKKDNTSTSSKPSSDGASTNDGNNTTSKPNNNGSSSNEISKPSNSGGSNNKKPTSPTHTHKFVAEYKDIQHEEKGHYETVTVSEAWDEPVYNTYEVYIGNQSGLQISGNPNEYLLNNSNGDTGWHTEYRQDLVDTIHHPAKTEKKWIVDENGWTETVTTYKCSCGATK